MGKNLGRCKSEFLTMKESLTKKSYMVSLYQNMKLHFTLVFKLLSSNCSLLSVLVNTVHLLNEATELSSLLSGS